MTTNGQLIPGVPAFHQGTAPAPGQEQRVHDRFFGAHAHGPPPLPPLPGPNATFDEVVTYEEAILEDGDLDLTRVITLWKALAVDGGGVDGHVRMGFREHQDAFGGGQQADEFDVERAGVLDLLDRRGG